MKNTLFGLDLQLLSAALLPIGLLLGIVSALIL